MQVITPNTLHAYSYDLQRLIMYEIKILLIPVKMPKTGIKSRIFANLLVASQSNAWRAVKNVWPYKNVISQQFLNILHTLFSGNQHLLRDL